MDKINYNQHDWNKGEVIKEENLDNMENGIKQATDKINEIIDTEQDFKDRMADIDRRIDINNEELVIARDGCDNLGQRIERDQQYIYNILNDGSYLEFNGTDIDINNAKDGYTKDTIIKGQTYQNLIKNLKNHGDKWIDNGDNFSINVTSQQGQAMIIYNLAYVLKKNTQYTLIVNIKSYTTGYPHFCLMNNDNTIVTSEQWSPTQAGIQKKVFTTDSNNDSCILRIINRNGVDNNYSIAKELILLEGDWTNKEVPSEITGIESVGDKENNKISILSHNKNLFNIKNKIIQRFNDGVIIKENNNELIINSPSANFNQILYSVRVKANTKYFVSADITGGQVHFFNGVVDNWYQDKYINGLSENTKTGTIVSVEDYITVRLTNERAQGLNIFKNVFITPYGNDTTYTESKEDKKEILISLDGGLKSLPNGVADTIEQREDGIYLVQRVEKVAYTEGDENLDNCITDKTISYKAKATPIETKLDIDMSKWLTYQGVTYFTTTCNVQPTLSLKAPVDIQATVSNLQTTNLSLRRNNQQLEQENQQAEKELNVLQEQHDQQTADLLDMDMRVLILEE